MPTSKNAARCLVGDTGKYRAWVEERRWRHGDGIATTIATRDNPAPGVHNAAIRILRVRPTTPPPTGSNSNGPIVDANYIDLLEVTVDVRRSPSKDDQEGIPEDHGQGETITLDRDQAVAVRRALDAFIEDAVVLLPAEIAAAEAQAERDAIAEKIRATGNPFA